MAGAAKGRGTKEQRIAQAIERNRLAEQKAQADRELAARQAREARAAALEAKIASGEATVGQLEPRHRQGYSSKSVLAMALAMASLGGMSESLSVPSTRQIRIDNGKARWR